MFTGWWRYFEFRRGGEAARDALAWRAAQGIDASTALQADPDPRGPPPNIL